MNTEAAAVLVPHSPGLDLTDPFTIELWLFVRSVRLGNIVMKWAEGQEDKSIVFNADLQTRAWFFEDSWTSMQTPGAKTGQWQHLAVVHGSGTLRLYFDGVLAQSGAVTGTLQNSSAILHLGAIDRGGNSLPAWDGCLSDLRWSNVERYTANFPPDWRLPLDDSTRMLWRFDEGSGPVAKDSGPWKDHGTVQAGAEWSELAIP